MVGIARQQIAFGDAVEGGDQDVGLPVQGLEVSSDGVGEGADIALMVVIGGHGAHGRLPADIHEGAKRLVAGGAGGGGCILRIEREDHDALAALGLKRFDPGRGGGVAVAHAVVDHHFIAEFFTQLCAEFFGLFAG